MSEAILGNLLIVDDNPNNLQVLGSLLQQAGYKVRPALNGEIALAAARAYPPDLVLLDIRMPGLDGYETCQRLKAEPRCRDVPIIFISALNDTDDKLSAFRAGGVDYVAKPFQAEEVLARVAAHLQLHRLRADLEGMVEARTRELREALAALAESRQGYRHMLEQTIRAMALTIEKRDPFTAGHQVRVSLLAEALGRKLGWPEAAVEGLRLGALIHDIGKIQVPAEILCRPGTLSESAHALVRAHAEAGASIVEAVDFPWPVATMIRQHHERLDGSGYPLGLTGETILPEARILMVADVVEAMSAHRPYRPALGLAAALAEVRQGAGSRYDPTVAAACLALFENDGFDFPREVAP